MISELEPGPLLSLPVSDFLLIAKMGKIMKLPALLFCSCIVKQLLLGCFQHNTMDNIFYG